MNNRHGISLLEVLISMFIMTVGLLGVAALIPAGRHEIVEAAKLDNSSMVGRSAFRDMQVRGFLNPAGWRDVASGTGTFGYRPDVRRTSGMPARFAYDVPTSTNQADFDDPAKYNDNLGVIMDPLGVSAGLGTNFPNGYTDAIVPPLRRIVPFQPTASPAAVYDSVFRSSFDQITEANPAGKDFPAVPKWFGGATPAKRMSDGNYTWVATIASDGIKPAVTQDLGVSVAVFYKRPMVPGREFLVSDVYYPGGGTTFNQELLLRSLPTDQLTNKVIKLRPGQWVMLAGMRPVTTVGTRNMYKWFRVISAAVPDGTQQQVTLAGGDWPASAPNTRIFIPEGVVNVLEKRMPLEF